MAQVKMKGGSRLATAAGVITALGILTVAVTTQFEGVRLYAYQDVVGVWTACQGVTKNIHKGMKFTREACDILFIEELEKHEAGMRSCLHDPDAVPEKTYVAFVSFTYNVGTGGFCKSSVARRWNAGDPVGACNALLAWNKAGGRVIGGLTRRRKMERELCFKGLADQQAEQEKIEAFKRLHPPQ